ncbi:FtsK/SpoIIIE domain-containing protein [Actinomycetospora sp.]|jgi:hypothetical protein|uniref:FtsK/SpoIIIE domain-containing protein n=1 Tax=Actinomycetospora sp. TaxID=1872135 RepID=UPI002F3FB383
MTAVPARDRAGDEEHRRGSLFIDLVAALGAYRAAPPMSEQDLAGRWDRATLDRDDGAFHVVGLAVWAWTDVLRRRGEQPFRQGGLLDAVGRDSAAFVEYSVREQRTEYLEELAHHMAEFGHPLPDIRPGQVPAGDWRHVTQVVEGLRTLWLDPRLGIQEVDRLEYFAVAAHALCAPDAMWAAVDAVERHGTPPGRPDPFVLDPVLLLADMVRHHLDHQETISSQRTRMHDLRAADQAVRADLSAGRLSAEVRKRLTAVAIDGAYLAELADHQARFDGGGMWARMTLGSMAAERAQESARVAGAWRAALSEAEQAVHDAEAARERDLAAHVAAGTRFAADHGANPYAELRRADGYVGSRGPGRQGDIVFTKVCDVEPFPGRSGIVVPFTTSACSPSLTVVSDPQNLPYEQACAGLRAMILGRLATAAPRSMRFTWIDPIRQGHSAGPFLELLELDKDLIDGRVWSEPADITAALRRVTDRMATLQQRCLRDAYDDLDAYNADAGMLTEQYEVVVVTGFPTGFDAEAVARLRQILDSGNRVGVALYLVTDPSSAHRGIRPGSPTDAGYLTPKFVTSGAEGEAWPGFEMFMEYPLVFGHAGSAWVDVPAIGHSGAVYTHGSWEGYDDRAARAIVHGYGTASIDAPAVVIDSSRLVTEGGPADATSTSALQIPIGLRGRDTEVALRLGRDLEQNVLVGGLPGSGKSSLFHTLIINAVRRYSPAELQLYLLDFKQGVEFQPYAAAGLPHARVVAVQSEREFGLSVLRGLRREIDERATLFRGPQGAGSDSLREYRERTGHRLPRVLVVIDEFQVIFAEDDAVAHECAAHLDHVVRQGRAFGIHTVLGTQTLRGQGTLGLLRGTLDQIAVRIVLKSSEADARLFLADDNPGGARLVRPGQAIYNADGGSKDGNVEFQVAFTDDDARDAVLERERRRADEHGAQHVRPLVFDGTRSVDLREDPEFGAALAGTVAPDAKVLRAHVGMPIAIGSSGAVDLRRDAGAHVLVCDRDPDVAVGVLATALLTLVVRSAAPVRVIAVDGLGADEEQGEALAAALRNLPDAVHLRRRKLGRVLRDLADEVRGRLERDDYGGGRVVLALQGLHRMRELGDDFDPDGSPQADLLTILRDGSDVGVHVLATVDSVDNLERRLGHGALGEFGARVVGQCSPDASHRLVGAAQAARLQNGSMIVHQPDLDRTETVRPYPLPDPGWAADAVRRRR